MKEKRDAVKKRDENYCVLRVCEILKILKSVWIRGYPKQFI